MPLDMAESSAWGAEISAVLSSIDGFGSQRWSRDADFFSLRQLYARTPTPSPTPRPLILLLTETDLSKYIIFLQAPPPKVIITPSKQWKYFFNLMDWLSYS